CDHAESSSLRVELLGEPFIFVHKSPFLGLLPSRPHSRVMIRHNNDERTLNDVTALRIYYPEHETPKRGGKPEPSHGSLPTSVTLGETGSSINQEEIICTSSSSEPTGRREHS